jgi:hypothetical protein
LGNIWLGYTLEQWIVLPTSSLKRPREIPFLLNGHEPELTRIKGTLE